MLFHADPVSGHLTYAGHTSTGGKRPRFFALDPRAERLYAANQDSDDITGFHVDAVTGVPRPMPVPGGVVARPGSPSAISFIPAP